MSAAAISVVWDTVGRSITTILGPDFKYGSPPSSHVESNRVESGARLVSLQKKKKKGKKKARYFPSGGLNFHNGMNFTD